MSAEPARPLGGRAGLASPAPDAPVGVFDSGVGGLTVLKELRRQLPGESTVYLGDEARMPYGLRPPQQVVAYAREAVAWLGRQDVKLIVIACNTASSVALERVREESRIPIIGVVRPGAAAALSASSRRAIGVLATPTTVRSGTYVRALKDLDPFVVVHQQACPRLVPLVEAGRFDSDEAIAAIEEYVGWMIHPARPSATADPGMTRDEGEGPLVDTLLLGCTHYPLLKPTIGRVVPPAIRVVDSATTTAYAVREVLTSHGLLRRASEPTHRVAATGKRETFRRVAQTLFGDELPEVERADLPEAPDP